MITYVPGLLQAQCYSFDEDIADDSVVRVESSSEGDSMEVRRGNKTAPVLNLDCFHTGIS